VKEREPFAESHNVISSSLLILSSFNCLKVSHLRRNCKQSIRYSQIFNKLLHFTYSLQHAVQSPCSMDNISELEPSNSSFFSFYNHHGLHIESMWCPQYLSLLGWDNQLKERQIFSPGVNLCEIIEHTGQGAEGPEIALPLLHKVLKHLRRKEGNRGYQKLSSI